MSEHGMPDSRRTKRTKGVHHTLPPGHVIAPDPRHRKAPMIPAPAQMESPAAPPAPVEEAPVEPIKRRIKSGEVV